MNQSIFRAYDIRGKYSSEINEKAFFAIGASLGRYFISVNQRRNQRKSASIFVGRDVRLSSLKLKKSFVEGTKKGSNGKIKIIDVGISTTPMINFCAGKYKYSAAIITASHDPKNYNGLKVVDEKGNILSGKDILKIIRKISNI